MIHISTKNIAPNHKKELRIAKRNLFELSLLIKKETDYTKKIELAKDLWKNKRQNKAFDTVKLALKEMSSVRHKCMYCEISVADEIEHIYPKSLYPEKTFKWNNFLFVCGRCNLLKNDRFAIFTNDQDDITELTNKPTDGDIVFINPRKEDPLQYSKINFETFLFVSKDYSNDRLTKRFEYTFNQLLHFNEREELWIAHREAYNDYKNHLAVLKNIDDINQRNNSIRNLQKKSHPTVWSEMKRAYIDGELAIKDIVLHELFDTLPEALSW